MWEGIRPDDLAWVEKWTQRKLELGGQVDPVSAGLYRCPNWHGHLGKILTCVLVTTDLLGGTQVIGYGRLLVPLYLLNSVQIREPMGELSQSNFYRLQSK